MFRSSTLRIIIGISLCSLGGALLYVYLKNKDEDEKEYIDGSSNENQLNEKIVIPIKFIPLLIGRKGGSNIETIKDKSGVDDIQFKEKNDEEYWCEISGSKKSVIKAKEMLMKEIQKSPTISEEIFVPQNFCGKLTGKYGQTLQEICYKSLAKVSVDSGDRNHGNLERRIIITGNRSQVNMAKKLIEEKIKENEEYQKTIEQLEQKREPRRPSPTNSVSSSISNHSSMTSVNSANLPSMEKLPLNSIDLDNSLEVYVSAIANPSKFWLQIVGPQTCKLDELNKNMCQYYDKEENRKLHKIDNPYLGQIVAALLKYDNKWYRAQIVGILPNDYFPSQIVYDLYFVDYGDSEYVNPIEVFELRTDFLTLRFQAIECFLANVKPFTPDETWEQHATTRFEELTHVADWKKLTVRVVTCKERTKGSKHKKREGSPIPGVELFDKSGGTEINIAHALILEGFAAPENEASNNLLRLDGGDFAKMINDPSSPSHSNLYECNDYNTKQVLSSKSNQITSATDVNSGKKTDNNQIGLFTNGVNNLSKTSNKDFKNFLQEKTEGNHNAKSTILNKNSNQHALQS